MIKKALIVVAVIGGILALAFTYISARYMDRAEIERVNEEKAAMRASHDSLYALVAEKDAAQSKLQQQVVGLEAHAQQLRDSVKQLEVERVDKQLGIREISGKEALLDSFKRVFPEVKRTVKIQQVYSRQNDVWVDYLMVPLWISEEFMIDLQNEQSYKKQKEKLELVDTLQRQTLQLEKNILQLEKEKSLAFKAGYDNAYAKYDSLSQRYLSRLEHPEVNVGLPAWGTILGSAAVGVLVGTQIEGRK